MTRIVHYARKADGGYTACTEWAGGRDLSDVPQEVTCFTCKVEAQKDANLAANPDACPECGDPNTEMCPERGHGPRCTVCGFCEVCVLA